MPILDIPGFKREVKSFLYGNRYFVKMAKLDSTKLEMLACKVDLPQVDFNPVDADIGGQVIGIPYKYMPGELIITFYNTGDEYRRVKEYAFQTYNQESRCYKYFDDIKMDITITELDAKGDEVITHKYEDCIIRNISTVSLSYAESNQPEQFSVSFNVIRDSSK